MVSKRSLPSKRNPLLAPEHSPQLEILVERRRLGRTHLDVKPGQIGVANATKKENLGVFDYAHLRVPLPTDLKGTGIFSVQTTGKYPDAYFLMRRSSDGYVSATGMFKAAFPWASVSEESTERKHVRSLSTTADDEVAGNVWIPPEQALELGAEYSMQPWIHALLDPEPVHQGSSEHIATPPTFRMAKTPRAKAKAEGKANGTDDVEPTPTPARGRGRRSASPSKIATPSRKIASPRKPRAPKSGTQRGAAATKESSNALADAPSLLPPTGTDSANDKVKVGVETSVTTGANGEEVTNTKVSVEMPRDHPDLPLPDDAEKVVQTAKEMVEQAQKLEGVDAAKTKGKRGKRKAEEISGQDEEDARAEGSARPEKKVKMTIEEAQKAQVRSRALIGLTATLAFGAAIPYLFG